MSEINYPGYNKLLKKWNYSQDVYDGSAFDYYDGETVDSNSRDAKTYFPQKTQRESTGAYKERLKLLDPATYYATGVDSLVGTGFSAEGKAERKWTDEEGNGLGDPDKIGTDAYNFTRNADGNGMNWETIPKKAAIKLTMKHTVYCLVEGIKRQLDEDGNEIKTKGSAIGGPTVSLLDPECVTNKIYENGKLIACRVKEHRDERTSLDDTSNMVDCYVDYTLSGWKRWKKDGDNKEELGSGEYAYYSTSEKNKGDLILPIFEVSLPLDRMVGYIWAKKCIAIANFESQLDHAHRNVSFQILKIVSKHDQYEKIIESMKTGMNSIRQEPEASGSHEFLGPNADFFEASGERLKDKIKNFFYNMFKDYGDASKERTATEMRLESQSGIEAFLILLFGAVDELENQALFRVSQILLPEQPQLWGNAYVKRSNDFSPIDESALAESLANRYVTGLVTVPTDVQTLSGVLKKIFDADSIPYKDDEVTTIAETFLNNKSQERDLLSEMGV